jgi:hemolysin III
MSEMQLDGKLSAGPVTMAADEELANTITHGAGFVLSLAGAAALASMLGQLPWGLTISCTIYVTTLVMVYAASTASHAVQQPRSKHRWRIWDQGLIYTLIAGTYTPFVWAYAAPASRGIVLAALWSAALLGMYAKVVLQRRVNATTTYSYVLLGWLPALPLWNRVPIACAMWMAIGGLIYTAGTLFLKMDERYRYFHATWHVLVIVASICHYFAIMSFLVLEAAQK